MLHSMPECGFQIARFFDLLPHIFGTSPLTFILNQMGTAIHPFNSRKRAASTVVGLSDFATRTFIPSSSYLIQRRLRTLTFPLSSALHFSPQLAILSRCGRQRTSGSDVSDFVNTMLAYFRDDINGLTTLEHHVHLFTFSTLQSQQFPRHSP